MSDMVQRLRKRKAVIALTAIIVVAAAAAIYCSFRAYRAYGSPRIQLGTLGEWFAALFTVTAAATALYIASRDRRERRAERHAADEAQAALVIAQPFAVASNPGLGVVVHNYGTSSILQVTTIRLEIEGHPHLDGLPRPEGGATTVAVVPPTRDDRVDGATFFFRPGDDEPAFRRALQGNTDDFTGDSYVAGQSDIHKSAADRAPTITRNTWLTATVRFRDAKGNRWETVFKAPALHGREETDHRIIETYHVPPSPTRL